MKCLILAAGYATRLYPLTENFPKPLLDIGGKTILDWLVDDIDTSNKVSEYVVISNHKFAHHFEIWAKTKKQKISVVDDGTSTNETRLGAVKDIEFAVDKLGIKDDCLIIAGDNVLDFSLTKFMDFAFAKKASCVMGYKEYKLETLPKRGVLELDGDKVVSMEEKPAKPKSNWCCPPFYFYTKEDMARLKEALNDGCQIDAPGSFVSWLAPKSNVFCLEMPGSRYDVGNLESYNKIRNEYRGIKNA